MTHLCNCIYCIYTVITFKRGENVNIFIDNKVVHPSMNRFLHNSNLQIISGTLPSDEALPSIRSLAKDLRISVVTTKRAYDELEKEGFIYTIAAKGCFVAPLNTDLLRETNLKKIEDYMEKIVHLAASCNLSEQELTEMLHFMMEE